MIVHLSIPSTLYDSRIQRYINFLDDRNIATCLLSNGNGFQTKNTSFYKKGVFAITCLLTRFLPYQFFEKAFWKFSTNQESLQALLNARPTLIHAHDWDALFVATKAAEITGAKLIYDSHELATSAHRERHLWRLMIIPAISKVEKNCIPKIDALISVSEGIKNKLMTRHKLSVPAEVIMNMPNYIKMKPIKKPQNTVILHYHGILARGRGLQLAIETLALLPDRYELQFMGPEKHIGYINKLKQFSKKMGVYDRLKFIDTIPVDEIIETANQAHIGLCFLTAENEHNALSLPNKYYEYLSSGLVPIIGGSKEMKKHVEKYKLGYNIEIMDAQIIANTILSISDYELVNISRLALERAKQDNFESESVKLVRLYSQVGITI